MDGEEIERLAYAHTALIKSDSDLIKAILYYTGWQFKNLNINLRTGIPLTVNDQKTANVIDSIFASLQPINQTLTLYRGIKKQEEVHTKSSFISASHDKMVAKSFTGRGCCLVVITIPPGSKVLFVEGVSKHPDECEVLIDRTGTFSVTLVQPDVYEATKIFATYIPMAVVHAEADTFDAVIDAASTQVLSINRVVDTISKDEFEMFVKESEGTSADDAKAYIAAIYKQVTANTPTDNELAEILKNLAARYM